MRWKTAPDLVQRPGDIPAEPTPPPDPNAVRALLEERRKRAAAKAKNKRKK